MISKIIKRDGRVVTFDGNKITNAILKAAESVGYNDLAAINYLTGQVIQRLDELYPGQDVTVENVQDVVEHILMEKGHHQVAKAYILFRDERSSIRSGKVKLMDIVAKILVETHKENANISNSPSAKMLQIASAAAKFYYLNRVISKEFAQLHEHGDIHIHDLDFYGITLTCVQIPLGKLLSNGFNTGHGYIRAPKRIGSAAALAAIIIQSSQNDMHGGQSIPFFDRDMAKFVFDASDEEIYQAMEALVYNLNSMHSRAGAQVPFSSLNLGTDTSENGRRITKQLLLAYKHGLGRGETPIFPNIIFRVKEGVNFRPGDPNYDLFKLAIEVAAVRMNPTFSFMDSSFNKPFGDEVGYMGCRTRVMANRKGPEVCEGRGNLSFSTINLPRLAIRSGKDLKEFYRLLDEVMVKTAEQLYQRFKVQAALKVRDMPFLMGQKLYIGSDQLGPDDRIEDVIKNGTLSIGFIGLAETLTALIGKHHGEDPKAQELGLEIVKFMRDRVNQFSEEYDLNYSLLATPAEGLSGRFVKMDAKLYGVIPGVTDKDYYTNSFHVPVSYKINIHDKINLEGPYHKYTDAGHISYVEFDASPVHNLEALEQIIGWMKDADMGYAGMNFPFDFCDNCGFYGVIEDKCPVCGSDHVRRVRRITGYLSTEDRFNAGKLQELHQRVSHFSSRSFDDEEL